MSHDNCDRFFMQEKANALKLIQTGDGSQSLYHSELDETYHSRHGAIAESRHVFIQNGLMHQLTQAKLDVSQNPYNPSRPLSILEMGFGTGLNALLTLLFQQEHSQVYANSKGEITEFSIDYQSLEAYPLAPEIYESLDYTKQLKCDHELFLAMHRAPWEQTTGIAPGFGLLKNKMRFEEFRAESAFDLVYYDAFGARVQPELWEIERFSALYQALRQGGVIVTYAAKGSVRRALQQVGFTVERLPGPPGKREMLRATKI